jgi:excisionase family DNA binding protein
MTKEMIPSLTTADMEELFGVHRSTLNEWRKAGLPYYKLGGKVLYKKDEVLAWIEERKIVESEK